MGRVELLVDAVAVVDDEVGPAAWVAIADGHIHAVGAGRDQPPEADVCSSLHGATVLPGGKVAKAFLVAIGDDDIRGLDGLATQVQPGQDIIIAMAMSGG